MKVWPWSTQQKIQDTNTDGKVEKEKVDSETDKTNSNGAITNGHPVTAGGVITNGHPVTVGGGDKKTN